MRVSTIHLTVDAGVERIEASSDALNSLSTVRIASSAGVDHEGGRRQVRSGVSEGGAMACKRSTVRSRLALP